MSCWQFKRLLLFVLPLACVLCLSADAKHTLHRATHLLPQLPGRRGRSLTQAANRTDTPQANATGTCSWNAAASTCEVAPSAAVELFRLSNNDFAQFVTQFVICDALKDEDSCLDVETCMWNKRLGRCLDPFITRNREDSLCAVEAPVNIARVIATDVCDAHATQLSCVQDPNCVWYQDELACVVDDFKAGYGVSEEDLDVLSASVLDFKQAQLTEVFQSEFEINDRGFNWEDILQWNVPQTDCPEWSHPQICGFADGLMSIAANEFYCRLRYNENIQNVTCDRDPLCRVERKTYTCEPAQQAERFAYLQGLRNMILHIGGSVDRDVASTTADCKEIGYGNDECPDICIYDAQINECGGLTEQALLRMLAAPSDEADALCVYATVYADSGCLDVEDPSVCENNNNCTLFGENDCDISSDYLIRMAVERNLPIQASYNLLEEACGDILTMEACLAEGT